MSELLSDTAAVSIRPARPEDAGAVAELCKQLGYAAHKAEVRDRLSAIARSASQVVLVASWAKK